MFGGLLGRVLNGPVISTGVRYVMAALGGYFVAAGYGTTEDWAPIAGALTVLIMAAWGIIEARTNKVVSDGKRVTFAELPPSTVKTVQTSVQHVVENR